MNICIDASLVIPMIVGRPETAEFRAQFVRWQAEEAFLMAPLLLMYEVANGLHQYWRTGKMSPAQCRGALEDAYQLGIVLLAPPELHAQAMELAIEAGLPATYDAHYLALARLQRAQFYTADRRLGNSLSGRVDWFHYIDLA